MIGEKDPKACPDCGSHDVRRSTSLPMHLVRLVTGSRRRWCRACGRKWHLSAGISLQPRPLTEQLWFIALAGILVGSVVAHLSQGLIRSPHPAWVYRRIPMKKYVPPRP